MVSVGRETVAKCHASPWGMGVFFGDWGVGFRDEGLGFGGWDLVFGVWRLSVIFQ